MIAKGGVHFGSCSLRSQRGCAAIRRWASATLSTKNDQEPLLTIKLLQLAKKNEKAYKAPL